MKTSIPVAWGRRTVLAGLLVAALLLKAQTVSASDLGRSLFESGQSPEGTSSVQLSARAGGGEGAWVMRGRTVACANCHGLAGEGGREGFQRAPSLRWPEWSSTNASLRSEARERLRRAVLDGHRLDGTPLGSAMPRFDMDEVAFNALTTHLELLSTGRPLHSRPTFALLRLTDGHASMMELTLQARLQGCLNQRLGDRLQLREHNAKDTREAIQVWRQLALQPEVLAVLAPPWRGWRPPIQEFGMPLGALFPLVADPEPDLPATQWLFGGEQARAAALVQAWLMISGNGPSTTSLAVWTGQGDTADARWRSIDDLAKRVHADTGRQPRFSRLQAPHGDLSRAALWLDPQTSPGAGWWLVPQPVAAQPEPGARWWMAQPFAGLAQRPLAERWADAVCVTLEATLAKGTIPNREAWAAQLENQGKLDDGMGWAWQVHAQDTNAMGAVMAWSVVSFGNGEPPRLVNPRVDLSWSQNKPFVKNAPFQ